MSFIKKLDNFLNDAQAANLISDETNKNLREFARSSGSKAGIMSFIGGFGFFGGIAVLLGMILIISHNWSQIPNLVKISVFISSLVGIHFSAFLMQEKYPKMAQVFHFVGAGYIIAGIGLVAQIFHLSSNSGSAVLLWFIMILPLAIILRNKWIGNLAVLSFYLWLVLNSVYHNYGENFQSVLIYSTVIATNLILLPRMLDLVFPGSVKSFDHVRFIGNWMLGIMILFVGFVHEFNLKQEEISLHPVLIAIFVLNIAMLFWLSLRSKKEDILHYSKTVSVVLFIMNVVPFFAIFSQLVIVSILYWLAWFFFSGFMIYEGVLQQSRSLINIGSRCVMIGILARFIDLVGTMLFTGSMFILFGLILILVAALAEKYRKNLINKILETHAK